jgi:hypothetical protein
MSYANPQAVIDTESAKYYAQAISSLGQSAAKIIKSQGDKARAQAKENKKKNLENFNLNTKYSEQYLAEANKLTKDFDLRNYIGEDLNNIITKAANAKVALQNSKDSNERLALKKEVMMYEQFFNGGGLEEGITNLAGEREDFSSLEQNMGNEDGLSASGTNANLYSDLGSTFTGRLRKPLKINFENVEGALNMKLNFEGGGSYNANKDFGPETVLVNPNVSKGINNTLETAKIQVGENINQQSKGFQDLTTGKTIEKNGLIFDEISYDRLYNLLSPNLVGVIGGIVKSGKSGQGDLGMGLRQVQSYVDDILPEKYDKLVGTLEPDVTQPHGLTEESWNKLSKAIVEIKKENIQNGLKAKATKTERTISSEEVALQEGLNLALYLQKTSLPLFKDIDSSMDLLKEIDKYTSVDISKESTFGETGKSVQIGSGKNKQNITSDMSQGQIKAAILRATGIPNSIITKVDFSDIGGLNAIFGQELERLAKLKTSDDFDIEQYKVN